jgi:3-hydroxyisobutyrate dehydrogenase
MTAAAERPVAVVGLGNIGYPIASRVHGGVRSLRVRDSDDAKAARFVREHAGATAAETVGDLSGTAVVLLSLPDSAVVDAVVAGTPDEPGLIDVLSSGSTVIDMSSSRPDRSRSLEQELAGRGIRFLDAPVSGGVRRAFDGSLSIMVGGDAALLDEHRALLERIGTTITHVGPAGAGHAAKALNNYVSAAGLVATVEALLAGRGFGIDPLTLVDVFNSSTGRNYTTEHKARQAMLSGTFDSGFGLQLMAKDVRTAVELAGVLGVRMALGDAAAAVWADAASSLGPGADHTEIYSFLERGRATP